MKASIKMRRASFRAEAMERARLAVIDGIEAMEKAYSATLEAEGKSTFRNESRQYYQILEIQAVIESAIKSLSELSYAENIDSNY